VTTHVWQKKVVAMLLFRAGKARIRSEVASRKLQISVNQVQNSADFGTKVDTSAKQL